MDRIITFDLSTNGIKNAQKQINQIIKQLSKQVNTEFIRLSLEWIKNRSNLYLNQSGHDLDLIYAIEQSWNFDIKVNVGRLINNYDKSAYIEFGVGSVGENQPYPTQFANDLYWKYNLPTMSKNYMTGEWSFVVDNYDIVDIRQKNITKQEQTNENKTRITTAGNEGALFMYNAIMDYANNISIPAQLYRQAWEKM